MSNFEKYNTLESIQELKNRVDAWIKSKGLEDVIYTKINSFLYIKRFDDTLHFLALECQSTRSFRLSSCFSSRVISKKNLEQELEKSALLRR